MYVFSVLLYAFLDLRPVRQVMPLKKSNYAIMLFFLNLRPVRPVMLLKKSDYDIMLYFFLIFALLGQLCS